MSRFETITLVLGGLVLAMTSCMDKIIQSSLLKTCSMIIVLTLVGPLAAVAQVTYLKQDFKQPKPFLYEVEKDGKVSHILGSMHAGIPLSTYPDKINTIFASATNMAFEGDPEEFVSNYAGDLLKAARYPEGRSLEQDLSPKSIAKLKELFGEKGFAQLKGFKPWVIASELSDNAKDSLEKNDPILWDTHSGIDMTLLTHSKAYKKHLTFLDDLSKKVAELENDTSAADLDKLLSYPDPVGQIISCANMAQRAYLAGNEEGFKTYNKSCETPAFINRLQQRTISWIPKMEPLLKTGNAFIVVGADHMNGPNGIENLLTKKGYKVKRIEANTSQYDPTTTTTNAYPTTK
jgi:uncharacterized protein YbaP (TraB family)